MRREDLFNILVEAVFAGSNLYSFREIEEIVSELAQRLESDEVYSALLASERKLIFAINARKKECCQTGLEVSRKSNIISILDSYKTDVIYISLNEALLDLRTACESHISTQIITLLGHSDPYPADAEESSSFSRTFSISEEVIASRA